MTTETKAYNGWTNYETWSLALILDNDEGSYRYWRGVAQDCWDVADGDKTFSREDRAAFELEDRLQAETEEAMPENLSPLWSQLLSAAVSEINYREIAENWIDNVDKTEDEEEDEDE